MAELSHVYLEPVSDQHLYDELVRRGSRLIRANPYNPEEKVSCSDAGWHSWRPDADSNWRCKDCGLTADRPPTDPCTLGPSHRWYGHDENGLLCEAQAPWDAAKRHHCACGASNPA